MLVTSFFACGSGKFLPFNAEISIVDFKAMEAALNSFIFLLIFLINILSAIVLIDEDYIDEDSEIFEIG